MIGLAPDLLDVAQEDGSQILPACVIYGYAMNTQCWEVALVQKLITFIQTHVFSVNSRLSNGLKNLQNIAHQVTTFIFAS